MSYSTFSIIFNCSWEEQWPLLLLILGPLLSLSMERSFSLALGLAMPLSASPRLSRSRRTVIVSITWFVCHLLSKRFPKRTASYLSFRTGRESTTTTSASEILIINSTRFHLLIGSGDGGINIFRHLTLVCIRLSSAIIII